MANSRFSQYDPEGVIVTINGKNITGYADGTFVKVARDVDAYTKAKGADGETTRVKSQNLGGTIVITLMQGSNGNDILEAIADQDELTSDAVFAAQIKDKNGTFSASGDKAWIKKKPDSTYAKETENREWTIDVAELTYTVGGATSL